MSSSSSYAATHQERLAAKASRPGGSAAAAGGLLSTAIAQQPAAFDSARGKLACVDRGIAVLDVLPERFAGIKVCVWEGTRYSHARADAPTASQPPPNRHLRPSPPKQLHVPRLLRLAVWERRAGGGGGRHHARTPLPHLRTPGGEGGASGGGRPAAAPPPHARLPAAWLMTALPA